MTKIREVDDYYGRSASKDIGTKRERTLKLSAVDRSNRDTENAARVDLAGFPRCYPHFPWQGKFYQINGGNS